MAGRARETESLRGDCDVHAFVFATCACFCFRHRPASWKDRWSPRTDVTGRCGVHRPIVRRPPFFDEDPPSRNDTQYELEAHLRPQFVRTTNLCATSDANSAPGLGSPRGHAGSPGLRRRMRYRIPALLRPLRTHGCARRSASTIAALTAATRPGGRLKRHPVHQLADHAVRSSPDRRSFIALNHAERRRRCPCAP